MSNLEEYFNRSSTYTLRGGVILLIIIHHLYQITRYNFNVEYNVVLRICLDNLGYWCTSVFFLLSGFGLFSSLSKKKLDRKYICSHMRKLLEPFLFIWLLNVLFAISVKDFDYISFIRELFTLSLHYSDSLWFFKVIFFIYLFVFLVYTFVSEKYRLIIIFIGVIIYILLAYLAGYSFFWYNSILSFPIGMLCASNIHKIKKLKPLNLLIGLLFAFLVLFFTGFFFGQTASVGSIIGKVSIIIAGVLFALLSIVCVKCVPIRCRFLDYCGKNSLPIYLFHVSLLSFLLLKINSPSVYFICVILLTFILVMLYNFLIRKISIK